MPRQSRRTSPGPLSHKKPTSRARISDPGPLSSFASSKKRGKTSKPPTVHFHSDDSYVEDSEDGEDQVEDGENEDDMMGQGLGISTQSSMDRMASELQKELVPKKTQKAKNTKTAKDENLGKYDALLDKTAQALNAFADGADGPAARAKRASAVLNDLELVYGAQKHASEKTIALIDARAEIAHDYGETLQHYMNNYRERLVDALEAARAKYEGRAGKVARVGARLKNEQQEILDEALHRAEAMSNADAMIKGVQRMVRAARRQV